MDKKSDPKRILDVSVARRIMEWKGVHYADTYRGTHPTSGREGVMIPFYTHDVTASVKVANKFDEWILQKVGDRYFCEIDSDPRTATEAEEPQLAILNAALKRIDLNPPGKGETVSLAAEDAIAQKPDLDIKL